MSQGFDIRFEAAHPRFLHFAFGLYALSYGLPALMSEGRTLFGYEAAHLSALGSIIFFEEPSLEMFVALLGFTANVLVVAGYAVTLFLRRSRRGPSNLSFRMACAAFVAALGSSVMLAVLDTPRWPHVGNVVWCASIFWLAAARRHAASQIANAVP